MQRATLQTGALLRQVKQFLEDRRPAMRIGRVDSYIRELVELLSKLMESTIENETRGREQRAATIMIRQQARMIHKQFLRAIELRVQQLLTKDDPIRTASTLQKIPRQPERLVEFARAAAQAMAPYARQLASDGLVEDFLDQLNREVDALRAAIDERAQIIARRVASRVAMMEAATRGRRLVRHIDAMLSMNLEVDVELQAEWRRLLTMGRWRTMNRRPEEQDGGGNDMSATAHIVHQTPQ